MRLGVLSAADAITVTDGSDIPMQFGDQPCMPQGGIGPLAPGQSFCAVECLPRDSIGPLAPNQTWCPATAVPPDFSGDVTGTGLPLPKPVTLGGFSAQTWLMIGGGLLALALLKGGR